MPSLVITLADIAALVAGELSCDDSNVLIKGVQTLAKANPSQASFLSNMKYKADLGSTGAGLVFLSHKAHVPEHAQFAVIRLTDPYIAFAKLQRFFFPEPISTGKIHVMASIESSARLGENVQVDASVSIGANVFIDANSIIGAGCVLEDGVSVGKSCLLHPRVVLAKDTLLGDHVIVQSGAVLGSDGFGFAWTGEEYLKIPQAGRVVVGNNVEIGANTCIDRGAIGDTAIKAGAKLDNLIQVAHNVEVGEHTVIAGQAGFAGSTVIGKGCQFGAQSGVAGHLKLVDGAVVGAKAGVIGDIKEAGMVSGFPAVPHRHWLKASALFDRLPAIWNKIKRLG